MKSKLSFVLSTLLMLGLPLSLFAATDSENAKASDHGNWSKFLDPHINAWADGTITRIDPNGHQFTIHGSKNAFATAHAEMRHELHDKLANVTDESKRRELARQVRNEWKDRLDAAKNQKPEAATDMSFNAPQDKTVSVYDEKDIRGWGFFRHHMQSSDQTQTSGAASSAGSSGGEKIVVIEIYELPENASYAGEEGAKSSAASEGKAGSGSSAHGAAAEETSKEGAHVPPAPSMTMKELKIGDQIMVGYDTATNTCYTVIRKDKTMDHPSMSNQPTGQQAK